MLEKLRGNLKNYFSNGPKAAFIVILFSLCFVVTIINAKKTIVVVIDGKSTQITTFRSTLSSTLRDSNIKVIPEDKITQKIDTHIENGDKIFINIKELNQIFHTYNLIYQYIKKTITPKN